MTKINVERLRALLEAATAGPWSRRNKTVIDSEGREVAQCWRGPVLTSPNAALIAETVNALPALLDELERLRERLSRPLLCGACAEEFGEEGGNACEHCGAEL